MIESRRIAFRCGNFQGGKKLQFHSGYVLMLRHSEDQLVRRNDELVRRSVAPAWSIESRGRYLDRRGNWTSTVMSVLDETLDLKRRFSGPSLLVRR
jgi:hypothetical protein